MEMDLMVLDGEIYLVLGDWDVFFGVNGVLVGWELMDYVFLMVLVLGWSYVL